MMPATHSKSGHPLKAAFLCLLAFAAGAYAFDYRVSLDGVMDNYEYGRYYPARFGDRTLFFIRPLAEAGFSVDGSHKIRGGLTYLQEFGAPALSENLHPLIYYHYDDERLQFRFGSFPRAGAVNAPEWFLGREFTAFRPFVQGAAVEAKNRGITAGAWVDWLGRQDIGVNEEFLFGARVGYGQGIFFAHCDFMLLHDALPSDPEPNTHVWDNGGISVSGGAARGPTAFLDTLAAEAGVIIALDRYRGDNVWHTPAGGFLTAFAGARMIGVRGFLYVGEPLQMAFGSDQWARYPKTERRDSINTSSPIEAYGRLDLTARFAVKENIRAELSQSFHINSSNNDNSGRSPVGYSQHFTLHAEFGGTP